MWGVIVSALASSVVSFVVSNITQQPAVTINTTTAPTDTEKDELLFWKSALFLAIGYIAYSTLKKG